jgi:hypothetical protein
VNVAGSDGIACLDDLPLLLFVAHGALDQNIAAPFKAELFPRSAQRFELTPAGRSCGARSDERSALADGTVAIGAVDFNGGARFAINFPVAVIVLREMAIVALHPLFQVNVG